MQPPAVFLRERHVGQHILLGVGQQSSCLGMTVLQGDDHLPEVGSGRRLARLGEDGPDQNGDRRLGALRHLCQEVPHEVYPHRCQVALARVSAMACFKTSSSSGRAVQPRRRR